MKREARLTEHCWRHRPHALDTAKAPFVKRVTKKTLKHWHRPQPFPHVGSSPVGVGYGGGVCVHIKQVERTFPKVWHDQKTVNKQIGSHRVIVAMQLKITCVPSERRLEMFAQWGCMQYTEWTWQTLQYVFKIICTAATCYPPCYACQSLDISNPSGMFVKSFSKRSFQWQ